MGGMGSNEDFFKQMLNGDSNWTVFGESDGSSKLKATEDGGTLKLHHERIYLTLTKLIIHIHLSA